MKRAMFLLCAALAWCTAQAQRLAVGIKAGTAQKHLHTQIIVVEVSGVIKEFHQLVFVVEALAYRFSERLAETPAKFVAFVGKVLHQFLALAFSQLSFSAMVRLNTSAPGLVS